MRYYLFILLFNTLALSFSSAQTGLTVGPPRIYFVADAGQSQTQYVDVTNPSKDYPLDLAVSFEDWAYSVVGDNVLSPKGSLKTSCADWLTVSEPFFSLKPGETKRLQLQMSVPLDKSYSEVIPVHTTMLFVTQLNPRISEEKEGANIRLAVRSGIKVYQRFNGRSRTNLEISNLEYRSVDSIGQYLELSFETQGNTWTEGQLRTEFLNQDTGDRYKVDDVQFYSLPGDQRKQYILLPKELTIGNYLATAMLFYGEDNDVKIAEIEFDYVSKI
ncbi:fimbrial biogenesis chaperone [Sphingobacterium faecale]|uniref:Molecular chaperone n=1 Tax=Sphingobacterium faecale TaxID=2803775 RepID=A0ABS1R736_9SPHI|nr:molecular chaperone [Sphingobacterium faecale]MBL1410478.1 molecular chaperone [Sphingobacterium faecale]